MEQKHFMALAGGLLIVSFVLNMGSFNADFMSTPYIIQKVLSFLFLVASTIILIREKLSEKSRTTTGEKSMILLCIIMIYVGWAAYFVYEIGVN